jgi:hypothetical protein
MVDIEYLKKINLVSKPIGQRIVAALLLFPNYRIFAKVDIQIENSLESEKVIKAHLA